MKRETKSARYEAACRMLSSIGAVWGAAGPGQLLIHSRGDKERYRFWPSSSKYTKVGGKQAYRCRDLAHFLVSVAGYEEKKVRGHESPKGHVLA